ncbi:PEP-CTERM sorting domain-containing protein [Mastigocladopsis repens]|uniref:PEP-CTERM sorting domain-containing protein n=1 Tax=Mastigocladopsis repens TaxID=221287 RepID=UPI000377BC48|nr:PEP-CTERM sorting domain-containing protein [Mastigocladopsis repens]
MLKNLLSKVGNAGVGIVFICCAALATNPVSAATFTFTQSYGSGDGELSGSFTGEDLDMSESITKEELTDFTATYSDTQTSFTETFAELESFSFTPTSFAFTTAIGDNDRAIWASSEGMSYIYRGDAFSGGFCGSRCIIVASNQRPTVSPPFPASDPKSIPEPGTLVGLSFLGLSLLVMKKPALVAMQKK